jgi:hypothetical protein
MARIPKLRHEDQDCYVCQVLADAIHVDSVISRPKSFRGREWSGWGSAT